MPEACFVCLDSTEYLRNGDQFPNRLMAEQEAANLLVNAKMQANAENMVGLLVTGGRACTVYETLTPDVDRVMASISKVTVRGSVCHFIHGLLIASLALTHRTNPRAEKRIVAFVASPLHVSEADLDSLARRLRRDDVAVDVVVFSIDDDCVPLLRRFVERVSKQGNSRFLHVPGTTNLTDALMSSPILLIGDDAATATAAAAAAGEGGQGGAAAAAVMGGGAGLGGFAIDPNVDPELAMAIRLSMEEEHQRQAAAAAAAANNNNNTTTTTTTTATSSPPPQQQQPAQPDSDAADYDNMSEEEMLQRALQLSLQEAEHATATTNNNNNSSGRGARRTDDDNEEHTTTTATASHTTAAHHGNDEAAQRQQEHDDGGDEQAADK